MELESNNNNGGNKTSEKPDKRLSDMAIEKMDDRYESMLDIGRYDDYGDYDDYEVTDRNKPWIRD